MIDYHCHILPEMDDGARSLDEGLAMARSLVAAGFKTVHCTPHCIRGAYDTTPGAVRAAAETLQEKLETEGIDIRLCPGMEYYLDEFFLREKELLPLGDSRLVLVEAPSQAVPEIVCEGLRRVVAEGFTPLVAHPERSDVFSDSGLNPKLQPRNSKLPGKLLFQGNLGSFSGLYGPRVQRRAYDLLRSGKYAVIGSDGHDAIGLERVLDSWQKKVESNPALRRLVDPDYRAGDEVGAFARLAFANG